MKVKILKIADNELPKYQTEGASGMDVTAANIEPVTIYPGARVKIPLGFVLEIPEGWEAQLRSRSGLTFTSGIVVANGVGTIDSDYRGEVSVVLHNITKDSVFTVVHGMKVAQLVFAEVEKVVLEEVTKLSNTIRSTGGFGSTDIRQSILPGMVDFI